MEAANAIQATDSKNGTYYYGICEDSVKAAMMGQVEMPSNVLYQANLSQGKGVEVRLLQQRMVCQHQLFLLRLKVTRNDKLTIQALEESRGLYLGTAGDQSGEESPGCGRRGLDEVDAVGQFIKDQPHGLVLGLQALEVLGHEGHMGVSSPGGAHPLELPAELQLERGDAIA